MLITTVTYPKKKTGYVITHLILALYSQCKNKIDTPHICSVNQSQMKTKIAIQLQITNCVNLCLKCNIIVLTLSTIKQHSEILNSKVQFGSIFDF